MPKLTNSGIYRTKPPSTGKWLGIGGDTLNANGIAEVREMYAHQQRIYDNYYDEKNVIIQHPGGGGKSTTVRFVGGRKVKHNKNQKMCIVVPQTLISKSFLSPKDENGHASPFFLKYPDGEKIEWKLTDLCEKIPNGKTRELKNWLLSDRKKLEGIKDAIILTTYHAIVAVWKNLTREEKKQAIKNTFFVMDEAHRILYQEIDDEYSTNETNCIGDMIKFITSSKNKNTYLWLTTATFIRGDNVSILPPDVYKKFKKDYLPLDKYWAEIIKHIQSFAYDFIVYKVNPDKEIETLLKNSLGKKTLFYCPGQRTKSRHGCKYEFRDRMLKVIRKVWKDVVVLDLITEDGRDKRKEQFINGEIKPDIVLSVDLMNEGVDWVECEQIFDIVPSNSLTRHLQKDMRLWRDYPGKNHIAHYVFFQFNKKALDEESYTHKWNEIFALWTASMILDEQLCPINIAALNGEPEKKQRNGTIIPVINPFKELFPDLNEQNRIYGKVAKELIVLTNSLNKKLSSNEIRDCIHRVVEEECPSSTEEETIEVICRYISAMFNRKSLNYNEANVGDLVDAGFKHVYRNDFDGIWRYASEVCGIKSLEELRKCYGELKTVDEWVVIAEKLEKENNGILYSHKWLRENGYNGLSIAIYRNLEKFSHIIQEIERHRDNLSKNQILKWVDEHYEEHGKWPIQSSGNIKGTNETWSNINSYLHRGGRGFPGGYSLAKLLEDERGKKNHLNLSKLTEEQILQWGDKFNKCNKKYPSANSGGIKGTNETWCGINHALTKGYRGLLGGSSLAQLWEKERGVVNIQNRPRLIEKQILLWIDKFIEDEENNGKFPHHKSGKIKGTNETWNGVDTALRKGTRGLPGKSSIFQLIKKHRKQ